MGNYYLFTYQLFEDEPDSHRYKSWYAESKEEAIREFDREHIRYKGKKIGRVISVEEEQLYSQSLAFNDYSSYYTNAYYDTGWATNNYRFTYNSTNGSVTVSSVGDNEASLTDVGSISTADEIADSFSTSAYSQLADWFGSCTYTVSAQAAQQMREVIDNITYDVDTVGDIVNSIIQAAVSTTEEIGVE